MKRHDASEEPQPQMIIIDPSRLRDRPAATNAEVVWHHELVGQRLIEAAATIRRMPMNIRPKQYGGIWPSYSPMTSAELQAFKLDLLATGGQSALSRWEREQNRARITPSSREIERAEEALGWTRYLRHDPELMKIVGFWANTTYSMDDDIPGPVRPGLREIARGLRRDRVPVRT